MVFYRISPCDGLGDVDLDGIVTDDDVTLVMEMSVGNVIPTEEQKRRADVDGDGIITATDSLYISNYLNGKIDTFPACQVEAENRGTLLILTALGIGTVYIISKNKKNEKVRNKRKKNR